MHPNWNSMFNPTGFCVFPSHLGSAQGIISTHLGSRWKKNGLPKRRGPSRDRYHLRTWPQLLKQRDWWKSPSKPLQKGLWKVGSGKESTFWGRRVCFFVFGWWNHQENDKIHFIWYNMPNNFGCIYFLFKLLSISDSFTFLPILEESTLLKHTQHFFHLSNKMIFWVADPMIARRMSKHPVPLRHWPKSAAPNRQDKSRQQLFSKRNDWMVEWRVSKNQSIFVLKSSRMTTKTLKLKGVAPARILSWWIRHSEDLCN